MRPRFPQPNKADPRPLTCSAQETATADASGAYIDNELARRARQGDLSAFEDLFNRHQKRIYNIALRMLQDETEAADATQEVFVRVYRKIEKLVSDEAFVTWLKTMAVNVCRDILRKRKTARCDSLDEPIRTEDGSYMACDVPDWSANPEKSLDQKHLQEAVAKAIDSLSPDYREAVTLYYIDGADVSEISRITGAPEGTIKSRLSRARAELKRKLECHVRD